MRNLPRSFNTCGKSRPKYGLATSSLFHVTKWRSKDFQSLSSLNFHLLSSKAIWKLNEWSELPRFSKRCCTVEFGVANFWSPLYYSIWIGQFLRFRLIDLVQVTCEMSEMIWWNLRDVLFCARASVMLYTSCNSISLAILTCSVFLFGFSHWLDQIFKDWFRSIQKDHALHSEVPNG